MEQRGQRVHVVALEGVDVAGEEGLLLGVVGIVDVAERQLGVGQRGPRPLQSAVDGGHGGVEQLGDLLGLPPQHVAQDQHGALAGGRCWSAADERQADRLAGDGDLAGIAVVGQ